MKFRNWLNKTPLCYAVENQNIEIINLLLEHKDIDINLPSIPILLFLTKFYNIWLNKTPLCYAVEKQNVEIVKLLLANENIDINCSFVSTFLN